MDTKKRDEEKQVGPRMGIGGGVLAKHAQGPGFAPQH